MVVVDVVDAVALRFLGPTDGFKATLRWFHGVRGGPGVAGGEGNRRRSSTWTCAKAYKNIDFKAQASSSLSDCIWLELRILFSNNKVICTYLTIESLHLFFSSLLILFFFLSFSRIFFLFSKPFHRTLSIKHK